MRTRMPTLLLMPCYWPVRRSIRQLSGRGELALNRLGRRLPQVVRSIRKLTPSRHMAAIPPTPDALDPRRFDAGQGFTWCPASTPTYRKHRQL